MLVKTKKGKPLLSSGKNNTKISKSQKKEYVVHSLNLRPHETTVDGNQRNVCPWATKGCVKACVGDNGHFSMRNGSAYKAQVRRTEEYFRDTKQFYEKLFFEIADLNRRAKDKNKTLVLRLNAYSDINHAKQSKRYMGIAIFDAFPDVIFYDYTKDLKKAKHSPYANYYLTYSHNEDTPVDDWLPVIDSGNNVAVVFELSPDGELPKYFLGIKVIDGDKDDKRFLDPSGCIVGLKFKGSAKKKLSAIASGFCIPYAVWSAVGK